MGQSLTRLIYKVLIISKEQRTSVYSSIFYCFSLNGVASGGSIPATFQWRVGKDMKTNIPTHSPKVSLESLVHQSGLWEIAWESWTYHPLIFGSLPGGLFFSLCIYCEYISSISVRVCQYSTLKYSHSNQLSEPGNTADGTSAPSCMADEPCVFCVCVCVCVRTFPGPSLGEFIPVEGGWKIGPRKHHQTILRWWLKVTGNILD